MQVSTILSLKKSGLTNQKIAKQVARELNPDELSESILGDTAYWDTYHEVMFELEEFDLNQ